MYCDLLVGGREGIITFDVQIFLLFVHVSLREHVKYDDVADD